MIRRGVASGCSWWPAYNGFQWSAHGPLGHRGGVERTEADAQREAQQAMGRLTPRQTTEVDRAA